VLADKIPKRIYINKYGNLESLSRRFPAWAQSKWNRIRFVPNQNELPRVDIERSTAKVVPRPKARYVIWARASRFKGKISRCVCLCDAEHFRHPSLPSGLEHGRGRSVWPLQLYYNVFERLLCGFKYYSALDLHGACT
jgi:hypothetical protein